MEWGPQPGWGWKLFCPKESRKRLLSLSHSSIRPFELQVDTVPKDLGCNKGISNKALSSSNDPPKDAEEVRAAEKENDTTKGVVLEATKPPIAPKDLSKDKWAFQSLEIVLAILPMHTKEDPKGKGPATTATATAKSTKAPAKDNHPLKIK